MAVDVTCSTIVIDDKTYAVHEVQNEGLEYIANIHNKHPNDIFNLCIDSIQKDIDDREDYDNTYGRLGDDL